MQNAKCRMQNARLNKTHRVTVGNGLDRSAKKRNGLPEGQPSQGGRWIFCGLPQKRRKRDNQATRRASAPDRGAVTAGD